MKNNNSVWNFFASVRLALAILFLIAFTSIIGTIIPQKEAASFYITRYGAGMAQFFSVLDIPDMYNSWWFLALLCLLSFNLVICSIDRFPTTWKQVTAEGLAYPETRLAKMTLQANWSSELPFEGAPSAFAQKLAASGWKISQRQNESGVLLFSQKGAWTRTGFFIVHASILVIFLGGLVGSLAGFKGSVMVPETMTADRVVLFSGGGTRDLGFTVRCNRFDIEFYPNGMPKEYTSNLTILKDGKEVVNKDIEVNDPLTFEGITFYQSSYDPYQDFVVSITNTGTGAAKTFIVPFQQQTKWAEEGISFGVINAKALGQSIVSTKIWFSDGSGEPTIEWADNGTALNIKGTSASYQVSAKQMYATGLQVAHDPGVWLVYAGFGLMLLGLYVSFFMSHRRIWLLVRNSGGRCHLLLAGSANKNRPGFEQTFTEVHLKLQNSDRPPSIDVKA